MRPRLPLLVLGFVLGTISISVVYAWTGPTQSPPNGNVAAPVNVGASDQVKAGGLGVGSLRVTGSDGYFNFGDTEGESGYGIRDSAGTIEFKNSGGAWDSIQSVVYTLVGEGGDSYWTANGNSIYSNNSGNVGIGQGNPGAKLQVTNGSSGQWGLYVTSPTYGGYVHRETARRTSATAATASIRTTTSVRAITTSLPSDGGRASFA